MNHIASDRHVQLFTCAHLGVLSVQGVDGRTFLQSQLTQDVSQVSEQGAALAGFCTAQGRLWATLLMAQGESANTVLCVLSDDLQDSLLKRLKMFVLRSKVTLEVTPAAVYGIFVPSPQVDAFAARFGHDMPTAIWSSTTSAPGVRWIRLPSASQADARYLVIANEGWDTEILSQCEGQLIQSSELAQWRIQDIKAGLPWIEARTQDMFIPQTVNLDLVAGVSFTKGCYPGQEVVARAHYRGTIKRRMHVGTVSHSSLTVEAGMDIIHEGEPDSPIGRVINAVTTSSSDSPCTYVLFEAPFAAIEQGGLAICTGEGPVALAAGQLPYPLKA